METKAANLFLYPAVLSSLQKKEILNADFIENFVKHLEAIQKISVCSLMRTVQFCGKTLDLHKKEKIFMTFYHLSENKKNGLTREELIERVYSSNQDDNSVRNFDSQNHNIIKLISRARKLADDCFGNHHLQIEWFHHNIQSKRWYLCRPDINMLSYSLNNESPENSIKSFD